MEKIITAPPPAPRYQSTALDAILRERGIKRTWLARKIGVSPSHLSNLLSGKRVMQHDTAERIASELHLPFSVLFDFSSDTHSVLERNSR